jgi:hypothetical protein
LEPVKSKEEEAEKKPSTPKKTPKSTPKRKRSDDAEDADTKKRKTDETWVDDHGRVFKWEGESYLDKGRTFYSSIRINDEVFSIGDTVYLASPSDVEPYIGKILALWEVRSSRIITF